MATEKFNWRQDCVGTLIDGLGSCEMIDSSGELVMLEGIDISSVKSDMVFNYEHTSKEPSQTVGKIYEVKKIFKEEDCENDRHRMYWNKVKVPFLYVAGELLDATNHRGAQEVRAMLQYDDMYSGKHSYQNLVNFSVEGSRLKQKDGIVHKCIMRKMTITHQPCLKVCEANILQAEKKEDNSNSIASISEFIGLIMDKSEDIKKGLSGAGNKYWNTLGDAKGVKQKPQPSKSYQKITTATPLPKEKNRAAVPKEKYIKRVHTSTDNIKNLKAGDSIKYKKPASKSGHQLYNNPDTFKNPPANDNGSDSKPEDNNKTEKVIIDLKKKPIKKALVAGMGVGSPSVKTGSNAINKSQQYWEVFSKKEQLIDLLEKKLPDTDPRIRIALAKTVAYKTLKDKEVKLERLIVEALNGK